MAWRSGKFKIFEVLYLLQCSVLTWLYNITLTVAHRYNRYATLSPLLESVHHSKILPIIRNKLDILMVDVISKLEEEFPLNTCRDVV